ncbi:MAG: Linear amide hydrolase [Parachlamydiales bacterium]|nr:Linear amide hydrolase [Parachlamydiales bacterium]
MRFVLALCCALVAVAQSVMACTAFQLKCLDNALIYCRTMEFGMRMDSDLLIIPRGTEFTATAPDAKLGMRWTAKLGLVGMNQSFGPMIVSDGMNEKGLVVGCLLLPGFSQYEKPDPARANATLAAWEVPDYLLSTCASVKEARQALSKVIVAEQKVPGYDNFSLPLHFYICDTDGDCLIVEYVAGKRHEYDNPLGVLTNAPSFDWHLSNLMNYVNLSSLNISQMKLGNWTIDNFNQGSGLLGLPGDPTPQSRFVRAALYSHSASIPNTALEGVRMGFHILNTFDIFEGLIKKKAKDNSLIQKSDATQWVVVHDRTNLKTYVRNYDSLEIQMVDLKKIDFQAQGPRHIGLRKDFAVRDITTQDKLLSIGPMHESAHSLSLQGVIHRNPEVEAHN